MGIRLTFSSNAPWVGTGYGNQTRTFINRLKALDCVDDAAMIAWWGLEGGVLDGWNGMRIYPKGMHPYGSDVMGAHSQHFGADLLITLIDAWVLNPTDIPPGLRWCVPANTLIDCADGTKRTIADIVENKLSVQVVGYDNGKPVAASIKDYQKIPSSQSGEIIVITSEDGRRLEVTSENGIAVQRNGKLCWIEAGEVIPGDVVYSYSSRQHDAGVYCAETSEAQSSHSNNCQLSAVTNANGMGVCCGDNRWRGVHFDRQSNEEGNQTEWRGVRLHHPDAERSDKQHQSTVADVVGSEIGYARELSPEIAAQWRNVTQARAISVLRDDRGGISVLQPASGNTAVHDCKKGASGNTDALYQSAVRGQEQSAILAGRCGGLAANPIFEPQRVRSVQRIGRPYTFVYDLTTSTSNFVAGGILVHNCPWFPIDSEPVPPPVLNVVKEAWKPLVYSRFGQKMMEDAGVECTYIPHGIDRTFFQPMNQDAARERLGWPKDRYIVGMVAANKDRPSRKAFTANLAAFAAFQKDHPDAMLYLHTQMTDRVGGENLAALIESLGITNVMAPDPYGLLLGYGDDHMATLYSAFDVLLSVSMGEGFSMTPLEAQSCGTPVIVGQWTATEELLFGGWGVDKADTEPFWTPLGAWQRIPHVGAIKEALDEAWRGDRAQMGRLGELGAAEFDADLVTQIYWRPFLESVEKAIEVNKTITGAAAENGGEDKLKAKLNKKLAAA